MRTAAHNTSTTLTQEAATSTVTTSTTTTTVPVGITTPAKATTLTTAATATPTLLAELLRTKSPHRRSLSAADSAKLSHLDFVAAATLPPPTTPRLTDLAAATTPHGALDMQIDFVATDAGSIDSIETTSSEASLAAVQLNFGSVDIDDNATDNAPVLRARSDATKNALSSKAASSTKAAKTKVDAVDKENSGKRSVVNGVKRRQHRSDGKSTGSDGKMVHLVRTPRATPTRRRTQPQPQSLAGGGTPSFMRATMASASSAKKVSARKKKQAAAAASRPWSRGALKPQSAWMRVS
jgi:hypothetical protein